MKPHSHENPSVRGRVSALFTSLMLFAPTIGAAQQDTPAAEPPLADAPVSGQSAVSESQGEKIVWFGRWEDARAEAARTGRPILLMSAAPQCTGAPGMW